MQRIDQGKVHPIRPATFGQKYRQYFCRESMAVLPKVLRETTRLTDAIQLGFEVCGLGFEVWSLGFEV